MSLKDTMELCVTTLTKSADALRSLGNILGKETVSTSQSRLAEEEARLVTLRNDMMKAAVLVEHGHVPDVHTTLSQENAAELKFWEEVYLNAIRGQRGHTGTQLHQLSQSVANSAVISRRVLLYDMEQEQKDEG